MKGVIYTRVSSDEQIEGTSLASQDELCRRYCEQKGITVVALYREEGETAKDLSLKNRSQFLAALEFCRKQKDIKAFVVFKVDRFARNADDHFSVRRLLSTYGTSLHSVTEPIGDKPAEKFIETVLAGAAEYDNAIRKERCTGGMLARINQGIWPFQAPIGYACAHHGKRGEKKTVADQPDPILFPIIQRALRAYANGEIGSQAMLTRQLNLWGFAAVRGKPAYNQLVHNMLAAHLPFYTGVLVNPWTKKETPGAHIPMITAEDRDRITARRRGIAYVAPAKRTSINPAFPLRRVLRCTVCGRYLTGCFSGGNGGKYPYYYCLNRNCSLRSKTFRGDIVEPRFILFLRRLAERSDEHAETERRLGLLVEKRADQPRAEREALTNRLADLITKRARICEMREDGTYDASVFRERLAVVDHEIEELKAVSVSAPNLASVDPDELTASIHWLLPRVAVLWRTIPPKSRPRFEWVLFPNGIRYEAQTGFRTTKPGLILAIKHGRGAEESMKVLLKGFSSNQLYEYFSEVIALYHELKDWRPEETDLDSAT
jgi:DNA invertase Pin-like site-specific DNA recombinase